MKGSKITYPSLKRVKECSSTAEQAPEACGWVVNTPLLQATRDSYCVWVRQCWLKQHCWAGHGSAVIPKTAKMDFADKGFET